MIRACPLIRHDTSPTGVIHRFRRAMNGGPCNRTPTPQVAGPIPVVGSRTPSRRQAYRNRSARVGRRNQGGPEHRHAVRRIETCRGIRSDPPLLLSRTPSRRQAYRNISPSAVSLGYFSSRTPSRRQAYREQRDQEVAERSRDVRTPSAVRRIETLLGCSKVIGQGVPNTVTPSGV